MGTRSYIGVRNGNKVDYIYCHWDGYIEGVGKLLVKCVNDQESAKELVSLGAISFLDGDEENAKKCAKSTDSNVVKIGGCYAAVYTGNRAEETFHDTYRTYTSKAGMERDWAIEYRYLFDDGEWQVASRESDWNFVSVASALEGATNESVRRPGKLLREFKLTNFREPPEEEYPRRGERPFSIPGTKYTIKSPHTFLKHSRSGDIEVNQLISYGSLMAVEVITPNQTLEWYEPSDYVWSSTTARALGVSARERRKFTNSDFGEIEEYIKNTSW